jgi:hypothetical protein
MFTGKLIENGKAIATITNYQFYNKHRYGNHTIGATKSQPVVLSMDGTVLKQAVIVQTLQNKRVLCK